MVPIVPGVWRYASRTWRIYSSWPRSSSTISSSPLRFTQRWAFDEHGVAVVPQTAQQRLHHGPIAQEVRPLVVVQVRCNDRGMVAVALFHQLEEDIGLLRFQV